MSRLDRLSHLVRRCHFLQNQTSRYSVLLAALGFLASASHAARGDTTLIMPLGDSITDGTGATSQSGYRGPLYLDLTSENFGFQYVGAVNTSPGYLPSTPVNQQYENGYPGYTTSQIFAGVTTGGWLGANPNIVLLHIGTNNVGGSESGAISDVAQIIDAIESHNSATKVFLAEIVPFPGHDAFINQYNADLVALASAKNAAGDHVTIVNLNTNFSAAGNSLSSDNEHPNAAAYSWMAQQWDNAIIASTATIVAGAHTWDASGAGAQTDGAGSWDTNSPAWWNGSASVAWNNAANDVATFGANNGMAGTVTLATGINVGGLTFNPATNNNYTIAGNTLTFGGSAAAITTNVDAAISSNLAGSAQLIKQGPGKLTLTGVNSTSNGFVVSQGVLSVQSQGATNSLGSGPVTLAGGTLRLAGVGGGQTSGQQTLSLSGFNQDLIWGVGEAGTAAAATTGSLAGWVWYEHGNGSAAGLPVNSGTAPRTFTSAFNSSVQFQFADYGTGAGRNNNALLLAPGQGGTLTLANSGSFQQVQFLDSSQGAGGTTWNATLHFSDSSSAAISNFSDPDFTLTGQNALQNTGLANVSGSFYPGGQMFEQDYTLSAADQAKTLTSITFQTVSSNGAGMAVFAVSGFSLAVGQQNYGNAVTVTADATIDVQGTPSATLGALAIGGHTLAVTGANGSMLTVGPATLSGDPTFDVAAGVTMNLGAIDDGGVARTITKSSGGTLRVNAAATSLVAGAQVNVGGGTLRVNQVGALGTAAVDVAAGATLSLGANQSVAALTGSGAVQLNGNTLTVSTLGSVSAAFSGSFADGSATGGFVKSGTGALTLTGTNSSAGPTSVNQGMLVVANYPGHSSLASGPVTLGGGTLRLAGQTSAGGVTQQVVPLNGFNQDLIWSVAEQSLGYAGGTTAQIATWVWYEHGISGGSLGLPTTAGSNNTFTSAANSAVQFQFAGYGTASARNNNGLLVGVGSNGTLTLATPASFQALQFLTSTQGSSPPATWFATLNFTDGSHTVESSITDLDWTLSEPGNDALVNAGLYNGGFYNGVNLREHDFTLSTTDQQKTLASVAFAATAGNGAGLVVFAASGQLIALPQTLPTQTYANTFNVTADSTIDVQNSAAATIGALSIGPNKLSLTGVSGASLTLGATTLTGNATFDPAARTTMILSSITDGGVGYGFTKTSTGTLRITAAGSYSGPVQVNAGTLRVSNGASGSATGSGPVTLNGGTLAGAVGGGTIGGAVAAGTGAHTIAPGAGLSAGTFGTLNLNGGLTTSSNTTLAFNLGTTAAGNEFVGDLLDIGGAGLTVGAGTKIAFGTNPTVFGDYRLIGGNFNTADLTQFVLPTQSGVSYSLSILADPSYIDLVVAPGDSSRLTLLGSRLTLNMHAGSAATPGMTTVMNSDPTSAGHFTPSSTGADGLSFTPSTGASVAASDSTTLNVGWSNTTAAGPRSGQITISNDGDPGDSNSPKTQVVTGAVYNLAAANTIPTVNLGAMHAGSSLSQAITLANVAPTDATYSETLTSGGFSATSPGFTATGTIGTPLVAGGASDSTSLVVGVGASLAAGHDMGTTTLALTSNEVNGSGLGATSLAGQTVTITADVFSGNAQWASSGGGVWSSSTWSDISSTATVSGAPGIYGFSGDMATFAGGVSGSMATISLNGATPQLAAITFNNSSTSYTIAQGSPGTGRVTLSNGRAPATITVAAGSHTISAPVTVTGGLTTSGPGTIALTGAGNSFTGPITVGDGSSTGTLRLNVAGASTIDSGVTVTVAQSATLELDGTVSALKDSGNSLTRPAITNSGMLSVGDTAVAPMGTTQQVGGIDGDGSVVVNDGASLTADHINQTSLIIGAGSTFTLAPSNADGSPMASNVSGLALAGSLTPASLFIASGGNLLGGGAADSSPSVALGGGENGASISAVPEPSTIMLLILAGLAALPLLRRQS